MNKPRLSIVLIDWSVRESFHILKYLSEQTISRDKFEVIWIEFYSARGALRHKADKFVILDMPKNVYYHKHLMYNVGILEARSELVMFLDSDAIVLPTFVKSVLTAFENKPNIVVHVDQVRNHDKRFYPFNYPKIQDVLGKGCSNWRNGTTTGMMSMDDQLHRRNYGACMTARRDDLLKIGGADEHLDYLGYICGPYDMTFRLKNAGVEEVWLPKEFTYHVWHPAEGGGNNREGPHDGRKMSARAMAIYSTKRTEPFVRNKAFENPSVGWFERERVRQWCL